MKVEARQRFSSDADLEGDDATLQMPRRPAGLRSAPPVRKPQGSGGGGGSLRVLPVLFALLALASLGGLVHFWGLTASIGGGDVHHPPLTSPFRNETMVQFTTKFGASLVAFVCEELALSRRQRLKSEARFLATQARS